MFEQVPQNILQLSAKFTFVKKLSFSPSTDDASLARYRAGFNECASEVTRYLMTADNINERLQTQILSHLASYYTQTESIPKQQGHSRVLTRLSPATMSALPATSGRFHAAAPTTSHLNALPSPPSSPFKARDKSLVGVVASPPVVLGNGVPAILVPNDTRLHFLPFALPNSADTGVWRPW